MQTKVWWSPLGLLDVSAIQQTTVVPLDPHAPLCELCGVLEGALCLRPAEELGFVALARGGRARVLCAAFGLGDQPEGFEPADEFLAVVPLRAAATAVGDGDGTPAGTLRAGALKRASQSPATTRRATQGTPPAPAQPQQQANEGWVVKWSVKGGKAGSKARRELRGVALTGC